MLGHVRTNEKCPVCRQSFTEELVGRSIMLLCPTHRTSPRRFYVDTSGFGLKRRKRYKGKDGKPFFSREAAQQFLDVLRTAKKNTITWDPRDWDEADEAELRYPVEWEKWVAEHSVGPDKWSSRYQRQVENARKRFISPVVIRFRRSAATCSSKLKIWSIPLFFAAEMNTTGA